MTLQKIRKVTRHGFGYSEMLLNTQKGAFLAALDIVTYQVKFEILSRKSTVSDLTESLEFTQAEVLDLKVEIKTTKI